MRRVVRYLSILVAFAVAVITVPLLDVASVASSATPADCTAAQVTLTAAADESLYTSGAPVHVIISMHNHSSTSCSYSTGTFSPGFNLTNAAGVTVWGSCWFGGGPAPCAYFLRHNVLAPGATYRERLTWDLRSGHPDVAVPAGRYTFRANFPGLPLRAATTFVLTKAHNVTATLANSGYRYALGVGDRLTVRLASTPLVWTNAVSSDPRVLVALPLMNPVGGLFVFRALAPGTARVTAVGNPSCYPQCLMASRQFVVTVSVVAP